MYRLTAFCKASEWHISTYGLFYQFNFIAFSFVLHK